MPIGIESGVKGDIGFSHTDQENFFPDSDQSVHECPVDLIQSGRMDDPGNYKLAKLRVVGFIGLLIKKDPFDQVEFAGMVFNELVYCGNGDLCGFFQRVSVRAG